VTARSAVALLATAALALGAVACGDDEKSPASGGAGAGGGVKPVAEVMNLSGKMTEVTLDADFVAALRSLEVTPGPVGDAEISDAGVASFPITAGNVKYFTPGSASPFVQGIINHDGAGLSLEAGGKKVELENFDIDPGRSVLTGDVSVDGKQAVADAPLFFLDGRTLNPLQASDDGTAVLEGTTVKLKKEAADLLNETFGVKALKAGLVVGVAKITINTK